MASFARDMGKVSVVGAIPWRALKASMVSVVEGLPSGEAESDFWPRIIGVA